MSVTKTYNKLVRDKQFEIFDAAGHEYTYKLLHDPEEYKKELLNKLVEEAIELRDNPEDVYERADIQEVLNKLDLVLGFDYDSIENARITKLISKGGFNYGLYLKEITKE